MDDKIRELIVKDAIRDKFCDYCRCMDRIDRDLGYSVFTKDSFVDHGPHFKGTGKEFIDWACDYHEHGYLATSHQITNLKIVVDGDNAYSEAYAFVGMRRIGPEGQLRVTNGWARDVSEWVIEDGEWRIAKHTICQDFVDTRDVQINGDAFYGKRDRTDPSYSVLER